VSGGSEAAANTPRNAAEGRPSFLKKRSKKLLIAVADFPPARALRSKSFLVLFFKKEQSFFHSSASRNCRS
jgi:hypothetical protein